MNFARGQAGGKKFDRVVVNLINRDKWREDTFQPSPKDDRRIAANFILGELSRPFVVVTSLIGLGRLARSIRKITALIKALIETYVGHTIILSRGEGGVPDIHVASAMRIIFRHVYLIYEYTKHVYRHL